MTYFEYFFTQVVTTWIESWNSNFRIWSDLMTGNYEPYALLEDDDPYQECYDLFWTAINLDEILEKDFVEDLYQMIDDINEGKVELLPFDLEKELQDLTNNTKEQ